MRCTGDDNVDQFYRDSFPVVNMERIHSAVLGKMTNGRAVQTVMRHNVPVTFVLVLR